MSRLLLAVAGCCKIGPNLQVVRSLEVRSRQKNEKAPLAGPPSTRTPKCGMLAPRVHERKLGKVKIGAAIAGRDGGNRKTAAVSRHFCLFVCCSVMAIWKPLPVHCSFHLSCVERFRFTALRPPVLTTLVMSCRGIDPSIFGVESLASQYWHLRKIKVLIPDLVSAIQTQIGLRQISFQQISALWNSSFLWSGKSTIMTFQAKAKAFRYHGDQVTWSDMEWHGEQK